MKKRENIFLRIISWFYTKKMEKKYNEVNEKFRKSLDREGVAKSSK